MPAPFARAGRGKPVNNPPSGFPAFFSRRQPRVVTADPWAFLNELVSDRVGRDARSAGFSYVNQAFDFFEAARNPQVGSKPLLYYYSFLNLTKAALLIRRVSLPAKPDHGITDPRTNQRARLRLGGQRVIVEGRATDRRNLLAELVHLLGGSANRREIPVVELLGQVPTIHRTFTRVTERDPAFTPIKRVEVLGSPGEVWARLVLEKYDKDVEVTLPVLRRRRAFRQHFQQKIAGSGGEVWFETESVPGRTRGVDGAIVALSRCFRDIGVSSILTSAGYRFYVSTAQPRYSLPRLAASYAAFFYLGSVTRYRPDVFDSILEGGYSWVVNELIATEPMQFVYALASELAGVDVVRPYAAT